MKNHVLALFVCISLCPLSPSAEPTSLESKLAPLAKEHQGKVAIAVKNLNTGETYTLNADEVMPTASLIKFPVMVEAYYQFSEGKVKPSDMCTYEKDPDVKGSGVLVSQFTPGMTFCLRDAIRMMIVWSDNMATNIVLDHIGLPSTNARMESLGLPNTKINAKVFKPKTRIDQERGKKYGLGSTTPNEMVKLLELLYTNKLVSPEACKEMLGHMKACEDKDKFPRFLPEGTVVAMKTGSVDAAKTCAGIIYVPVPGSDRKQRQLIAVCVMTDENKDKRWVSDNAGNLMCAKVAKIVYDHYAEKK
jgi:beta-lactamase class A